MTDDAELLSRYVADRSEPAFAELVRRHVDLVYSAALRQMGGDHHRAQEVTQMVFADLARKAAALVRHPVLPAWLYRASYLEAAGIRRREGRRVKYERAAAAEAIIAGSQEGASWEEVRPVLDDAMNALNERDREAVLLRFFANCPFGEVGRQLGMSENAARMKVERALGKLQELLAKRGIRSPSAALAAALAGHAVAAAPAGVAASATGAALAASGGAAAAWFAFMTTGKLPAALTAAVALGGAGFGALHEMTSLRADRELAELLRQNQEVSALRQQNQRLAAAADQARGLREDDASVEDLQAQVRQLEATLAARAGKTPAHPSSSKSVTMSEFGTVPGAGHEGNAPVPGGPALPVNSLDRAPSPIAQTRPAYPLELRRAGVSGEVLVDFIVASDGSVQNAYAAGSTTAGFEDAAVQAVNQWTFQPGQKGGVPVNTHMQIPVVFTVNQGAEGSGWF